jgi:putative transposase
VSKSGKSSYGLGKFFSSIHSRAIKGLGFFSLCLIEIRSRKTFPLLMEQLEPEMKHRVKPPKESKKAGRGRPIGSKNKNRKNVELTAYLLWIQTHIKRTLAIIGDNLKIAYFVYDGAFGNNECLQMVKMCGVSLISKLQCNAALYFPYEGEYKGRGPKRKY